MMVYLDDNRITPAGWVRTYTVAETLDLLKTGQVTALSVDNDLGDGVEEGHKVLLWLEEQVIVNGLVPPSTITAHSSNAGALHLMQMAIDSIARHGKQGMII
jgi:hypothetical protein